MDTLEVELLSRRVAGFKTSNDVGATPVNVATGGGYSGRVELLSILGTDANTSDNGGIVDAEGE
jgi:hypothetical protein